MMRRNPALVLFVGSLLVTLVLIGFLVWDSGSEGPQVSPEPLVVHVAAGIRPPLEKIATQFETETGQKIELRFGGSQTLLANLELTKQGDLLLPADESYMLLAREKNLVDSVTSLATMQGVVLLKPGETRIQKFADLLLPEIKLAQANPEAAAIGKLTRDQLDSQGLWTKLEKKTTVFKGTVNDVANAVKLATVDAGIVWDAVAYQYPELTKLTLPELEGVTAKVQIGVLKLSKNPGMAREFARFCADPKRGLTQFKESGFTPIGESAPTGDLVLYSGSMLRPAIEETIVEFEKREGIKVTRVYNGCGILVAQMKADARPDLYFACDQRFMEEVQDQFELPEVISSNLLVIAVPKGNPKQISSLPDLGKANLKIGVGHEQQCALGAITKETFIRTGTYGQVRKNVAVESPTGDFLVNQLRTGSLDAVVAYRSNVLPYANEIDYTPLEGIPCAAPKQPVAIRKGSDKKEWSQRLIDSIRATESQKRFQERGFGWEAGQ
jgi:molybdenum ABC transporter molybdate-binding protein